MRLIIIIGLFLSGTKVFAQLNKRLELISNLKEKDSVLFTIRRINCTSSDVSPFASVKIVKCDSTYILSYKGESRAIRKTILTQEQTKLIYEIEKETEGVSSTTYDEYSLKKGRRTIFRARDIRYSQAISKCFP